MVTGSWIGGFLSGLVHKTSWLYKSGVQQYPWNEKEESADFLLLTVYLCTLSNHDKTTGMCWVSISVMYSKKSSLHQIFYESSREFVFSFPSKNTFPRCNTNIKLFYHKGGLLGKTIIRLAWEVGGSADIRFKVGHDSITGYRTQKSKTLYYCEIWFRHWTLDAVPYEKQFKDFLIFYLTNCHGPP